MARKYFVLKPISIDYLRGLKQSFGSAVICVFRLPLRRSGLEALQSSTGKITFFNYLIKISERDLSQKTFPAPYWGRLTKFMCDRGQAINWIHIFIDDGGPFVAKKAAQLLQKLNTNPGNLETHITLDTFTNWRVLRKTLLSWIKLSSNAGSVEKH